MRVRIWGNPKITSNVNFLGLNAQLKMNEFKKMADLNIIK